MFVLSDMVYVFSDWYMISPSSRLLLPWRGSTMLGLLALVLWVYIMQKMFDRARQHCFLYNKNNESFDFLSISSPLMPSASSSSHCDAPDGIPIDPAGGGGVIVIVPLSFRASCRFLVSYSLVGFPWSILAANRVAAPWFLPR